MPPDTVRFLLDDAASRLAAVGCDTPRLDARLLLQHCTGLSREEMILSPDQRPGPEAIAAFEAAIRRREAREPVSRILGEHEFYGRVFRVTPAVLDPRPDTETLVEAALGVMPAGARVLDLGTGSGAIIITLLAERPDSIGVATDVSAEALAVAQANATALGVADRLDLRQGSWFAPVSGLFDVIVSNPPYIPASEIPDLAPDVRNFDPVGALTDGGDGLGSYRAIASGIEGFLSSGGAIVVEIGAGQASGVEAIFREAGYRVVDRLADLGGHVRCVVFRQP